MPATKIPAPSGRAGTLTDHRRAAMSVEIDGRSVVFQFDDSDPYQRVYVRVADEPIYSCSQLLDAVGRVAVSAELGEGETVEDETVHLGTPTDRALAVEGIPHLYRELRDPRERKALRGLYHRLASVAVA